MSNHLNKKHPDKVEKLETVAEKFVSPKKFINKVLEKETCLFTFDRRSSPKTVIAKS